MQDCYPLKPILFYPLTFLIRKDSPKKNSLSGERKIAKDEEKRKTFSVFTFSDTVLCALVLSLFYALIQNVHCPGWPSESHHEVGSLSNGRRWRNMSGRIPSHVKGFRRPHLMEDGEMVFQSKRGRSRGRERDTDLSPEIPKIYKDVERSFSKRYTKVLTEKEKKRWIKNVMLFKNQNSLEMTYEELSDRIDNLKGPVDTKTMLFVWNYVHDHEKQKYIHMVEGMRDTCRRLADYYNVPWEYETEKFRYVHDKMIKMLMKREEFEIKNIKKFATDGPICARWEFQRYLKLKRRSWADFTQRMERKWTKKLQHSFRSHIFLGICCV
ncbi:Plasmodium exported protein (PHIST), unknown function [Plasmodium vivax]|uniref:Plasmodium RESA N-terminal domain-containing protein n=1 Tax=Plasmodium vivax TaxID=5855 RepID=A0A564ZSU5_PLAVI|nr:Plasmodium exported protein (PHIST), unknown function [Plasmodium vivax]